MVAAQLLSTLLLAACAAAQDFTALREHMVQTQIVARGVTDARVLAAMRRVPRQLFVPFPQQTQAYDDRPLPIGSGQTISQPYIVALMTELAATRPEHKALEIGTGSGYQAAVLSQLVKTVYSIEIVPALAAEAGSRLHHLGFLNVTVKHGDGYQGWPEHAPYDSILVTAAPPEIPQALVVQLKRGGRMIVPVGPPGGAQNLLVIEKSRTSDEVRTRTVTPVQFVPMVRPDADGKDR